MLKIAEQLEIPLDEFYLSFARSSGPGGQNVNKVNTKAILRWDIAATKRLTNDVKQRFLETYKNKINSLGILVISSDQFRDQQRNIADCFEKLRQMILKVLHPPKIRLATKPSKQQKQRRLETKKVHGEKKRARQKVRW